MKKKVITGKLTLEKLKVTKLSNSESVLGGKQFDRPLGTQELTGTSGLTIMGGPNALSVRPTQANPIA